MLATAIAEAAEVAHRGADVDARRSGNVPAAVWRLAPNTCRQRASALRRFAAWRADHPQPSLAVAVDDYAEHLFTAGRALATVASAV